MSLSRRSRSASFSALAVDVPGFRKTEISPASRVQPPVRWLRLSSTTCRPVGSASVMPMTATVMRLASGVRSRLAIAAARA